MGTVWGGDKEERKEGKTRERKQRRKGKRRDNYLGLQQWNITWMHLVVLGFHKEQSYFYCGDILAKQTRVTL